MCHVVLIGGGKGELGTAHAAKKNKHFSSRSAVGAKWRHFFMYFRFLFVLASLAFDPLRIILKTVFFSLCKTRVGDVLITLCPYLVPSSFHVRESGRRISVVEKKEEEANFREVFLES